jgi:lysophospholipase L1-like esterase
MGSKFRRIRKMFFLLRTAWSILGITVVLLLLTEAGFRLAFGLKDWLSNEVRPDRRILNEGYDGATWPIQHYRELEKIEDRWQPYVYFRQKPFRGETIAVESDGTRATWQPPSAGGEPTGTAQRKIKVLTLGGSSLWGFGARDQQSIPSLVVRLLHERGWHVEIKNLAEIGYVSTQEVVALLCELQAGYRPDLVIFYDGVNDTTSALLEGAAGLSTNEIHRRTEFNLSQSPVRLAGALCTRLLADSASYRFAQAVRRRFGGAAVLSQPARSPETLRELSQGVIQSYQANLSLVEGLGRSLGFQPFFYWQPDVFAKANLHPVEQEDARRYAWAEPIFREVHARIGSSTALRSDPAFHDLSGIFGDERNLVFIDYCHTTESANLRIAAAIVDDVIEAMRREPRAGSTAERSAGEASRDQVR